MMRCDAVCVCVCVSELLYVYSTPLGLTLRDLSCGFFVSFLVASLCKGLLLLQPTPLIPSALLRVAALMFGSTAADMFSHRLSTSVHFPPRAGLFYAISIRYLRVA